MYLLYIVDTYNCEHKILFDNYILPFRHEQFPDNRNFSFLVLYQILHFVETLKSGTKIVDTGVRLARSHPKLSIS